MLLLASVFLNFLQASDQQELPPKLYNDWWSVQIMNDTSYPLNIEPDDLSYHYFKDENRQPVFFNIFYINFPGYKVESVETSDSLSVLQSLSDVASLTLTGESCNDLSLKIVYLNKSEQVMQVKLRAVSS